MIREDYIKRRSLILSQSRPYTTTVKQRGTFYSTKNTFGTEIDFPDVRIIIFNNLLYNQKQRPYKGVPAYGPFKIGDLAHKGYNKTIGLNWKYIEDPEIDPITFKKNIHTQIWKDHTHS